MFCDLSVGHSEMYGYGFRPYEYLPPPLNLTRADYRGHYARASQEKPSAMINPDVDDDDDVHTGDDVDSPEAFDHVTSQEAALGMYALRSLLLPRLYAMVLCLTERAHITTSSFLVCHTLNIYYNNVK